MSSSTCDPIEVQRRYGYNGAYAHSTIRYEYYGTGSIPTSRCSKNVCSSQESTTERCEKRTSHETLPGINLRQIGQLHRLNIDHKLKGLDVKPRISLVDDRDHHHHGRSCSSSSDFISVVNTPLPPTPVSAQSQQQNCYAIPKRAPTTPSPKCSTPLPPLPTETSFYSPVRSNATTPTPANNYNSSYRKTSKSSDSLLNSGHSHNHSSQFTSQTQLHNISNRHSNSPIDTNNISFTYNSHNTSSTNTHNNNNNNNTKSFHSNPNILSPTSPVPPNNSPKSPVPSNSSSVSHVRPNGFVQPLSTHHRPNKFGGSHRSNSISSTPHEPYSPPYLNKGSNTFSRSYSTRTTPLTPAAGPGTNLSESYQGRNNSSNSIGGSQLHDDVILRNSGSTQRRNQNKRSAGLLSPSSVAKMSFVYDEGSSLDSAGPEDLSHLLEWELSLDNSDLRSHAWYHGSIPRARAEEIVNLEGHFLVRDCTTQPGDYVLTCRWEGKLLHFVIQKTVVQPDTVYERVQYELEDEAYDTIPDLICAYVGNKKMVTKATCAKILTPVNRIKPLSYYESLYKRDSIMQSSFDAGSLHRASTPGVLQHSNTMRTYDNRQGPPQVSSPPPPPQLPVVTGVGCMVVRSTATELVQQRTCRPATEGTLADEKSNSSDGIISHRPSKELSSSTHSLPRQMHLGGKKELSLSTPLNTQPEVAPGNETQKPPPKPSRVPSFKVKARKPAMPVSDRVYAEIDEEDEGKANQKTSERQHTVPTQGTTAETNPRFSRLSEVYHPSGSDSGNGSGDSIQTTTSDTRNRDSQGSLVEDSGIAALEDDSLVEDTLLISLPDMSPRSFYNLDTFSTFLLPQAENPPLDATAFNGIRNTLMETGSRIIAAHLTYADLEVLNGLPAQDFGLGVTMGIEMITLPQGSQLRKDIIERTECMRLLVAVTVLKADDMRARAEIIHRWIQIAIDTKTAMGNLYGFNNIMLGLCNPQISRLTATWHMVRQKFTDSAFSFESKLRSTLKAMNECCNPQAPNTIIPHILPFIMLCERDLEDIYSLRRKDESLLQWESTCSDYGLQMLLLHLQEGRNFAQNLGIYRRNAELILDDPDNLEDLILDVFRTEFHLKFLFGSRGALRDPQERYMKFQQILSALSSHCESSVESSV